MKDYLTMRQKIEIQNIQAWLTHKQYIKMRSTNKPSHALCRMPESSSASSSKAIFLVAQETSDNLENQSLKSKTLIFKKRSYLGKHFLWYALGQRLQTAICSLGSVLSSVCLQAMQIWRGQVNDSPARIFSMSSFAASSLLPCNRLATQWGW